MYEDYRVLFVDDEPNILNSLRRGLMDEEYYCHFAASGKEALEIIKMNRIAVIVTDMRMPEMNGLQLLTQVSEESPMTVKVVLSGYTQLPQILVTINQVDIFKFITKPWELDDFIQVIKKSLDYYIIQEQNEKYQSTLEAKNKSYQNILKKINEVVDDAKLSKEMLGICGKSMVRFEREFSAEEKAAFQSVFTLRETIFDLLTDKVTTQKKEMKSSAAAQSVSDYIKRLHPAGTVEIQSDEPGKFNMNLKMLETAIDVLSAIFKEEFEQNGIYCRINTSDLFTLTILSPNAETPSSQNAPGVRTELDAKMELLRAALEKVLELCWIKLQILKSKGSMAAEFIVMNSAEGAQQR